MKVEPTTDNSDHTHITPITLSPKRKFWRKLGRIVLKIFLFCFVSSLLWVILLKWIPVPFTPLMTIRSIEGSFSTKKNSQIYYQWMPYSKISSHMGIAVVASEDQNFPTHHGFDYEAIKRAMDENKVRKIKRGASTISQQVAKNVFLWNGRSYIRKGLEVYFTGLIEFIWGKKRILEVYMNVAEMGPNTFGVQAAARYAYGKNASKLTSAEAARLAAILPNPNIFSAKRPSSFIIARQNQIMRQMYLLGGANYLKPIE